MRESALRFSIFRILLGLVIAIDLAFLYPWRSELYGNVFFNSAFAPLDTLLPQGWFTIFPEGTYEFLILLGIVFSLLFAAGVRRRWVAPVLFAMLWVLLQRNPLATTPDTFFLHWFLLATCFVDDNEPLSLAPSAKGTFQLPAALEWSGWIILACGYCFAATMKLYWGDPGWKDGSAVGVLLQDSWARRLWYGDFFLSVPSWFIGIITYGALFVQLSGPLLIWRKRSAKIWWTAIFTLEVLSAIFLDVEKIVVALLVIQLFLWNPFLSLFHTRKSQLA